MRDRGRLTAPGDLLNGSVLAPEADLLAEPAEESRELAELAANYGLRPSSAQHRLLRRRAVRSRHPACLAAGLAFAPARGKDAPEAGAALQPDQVTTQVPGPVS